MSLNVSKAFFKANSILNQNVGKFDSMNIIGNDQTQDNKLVYLVQGITKGFYYKRVSSGEGDIRETINIVPENSTVEDALKKVIIIELVNLDGSFTRFTPKSKQIPERPSFQWVFSVKPNEQDTRVIT
jgi:hypothetical protein